MTEITYLEFDDPEDHKSNAYKPEGKTSFHLGIQPEMYLVAMIEEPKMLAPDVLPAVRQLMYASYEQGKRVGAQKETASEAT